MAKSLLISIVFGLALNIQASAQQIILNKNNVHLAASNSVVFSPDGKYLVVGSNDYTIKVWDLQFGIPITILKHNGVINSLAFSPDGQNLASASSDSTIKIWNVSGWKEIRSLPKDKSSVKAISFSSDGKIIASGSYQTIKLWNLKTFKEIKSFTGHSAYITSLSFSPDGKYFVSGGEDCKIKLWDLKTREEVRCFDYHTQWVKSVGFSPDGKYIASGSVDKTTRLWEIQSKRKNDPLQKHNGGIHSVSFSANGKYLASGGADKKIKVWDICLEKNIRTISSDAVINSLTYSPDGKYLVSAVDDGSVIIWESANGKKVATLMHLSSNLKDWIVYTPNGKYDGRNCDKYLQHASNSPLNELSAIDERYYPGILAEVFGHKQQPFEKTPPSIVLNIDSANEVSQKEFEISGTVSDENGIILVSINGIRAHVDSGCFNYKLSLNIGVNTVQIKAFDRLGNMTIKDVTINYKPSLRKDYALIFYESDYASSNLPNLKGTKKNADSLSNILQNKYGFETSVFANFSASQIESTLNKYKNRSYSANDQLLIYFTGHGQKGTADTTGFLLCANNTRMTHKEFNAWSGIDSCKHILVILDACYSGLALSINMIGDSPPAYNPRTRDEYLKELFKFKPARKALTSGEGKVSIPFDGVSEFTDALIKTLKANHGKLFNILTYHELKASIVYGYPKMETGKFSNGDEADGTFIFIKK